MEKDYSVEVEWRAFNLRPDMPPEGMESPYKSPEKRARSEGVAKMFEDEGLEYQSRTWLSNSRLALEASEYAKEKGSFKAFHRAVFEAYFGNGRDIGKVEELSEIARSIGMDSEEMVVALEEGRYREEVARQREEAWQLGITAIPTFIIDGKAIVGAYPYAMFERVMKHVQGDSSQFQIM